MSTDSLTTRRRACSSASTSGVRSSSAAAGGHWFRSYCSAERDVTSTLSPTTAIPARFSPAAGAGRSAPSARWAARRARPAKSTRRSSAWSATHHTGGCARPAASSGLVVLRVTLWRLLRATRWRAPLEYATAHTDTILATARGLLAAAMPTIEREGLALVGVSVANLDDDRAVQLALPFHGQSSGELDAAIDEVRRRFGSTALTRAVLLGRDPGLTVPLLPD